MLVYTLTLADRCWYVGTTKNLPNRQAEHRGSGDGQIGALWTRLHKPLAGLGFASTEKCKENDPDGKLLEHYYLQMLMKKHGIDKVRGATYVFENLPRDQVLALARELYHHAEDDGCDQCGRGTVHAAMVSGAGGGGWGTWYQHCNVQECNASTDVCGNPMGDGLGGGRGGGGGGGRGGGRAGGAAAAAAKRAQLQSLGGTFVPRGWGAQKRARREYQACGEDIADRPANHKLCRDCYSTRGSGGSSRRACEECGADIGGRPESHKLCGGCFGGSSQGAARSGGYFGPSRGRECRECSADFSDRPESHSVCLRCFRGGGGGGGGRGSGSSSGRLDTDSY